MSGGRQPHWVFAEDLRYRFFNLLLGTWTPPRSDRQLQELIDLTVKLVDAAVERLEQELNENN